VADLPGNPFDLILANIQRDVIERLLEEMVNHLQPSGLLILSGLLETDSRPMLDMARESSLSVVRQIREGDWIALAVERTRRAPAQTTRDP
ncbi:MAG: 50S ribosomal protein L11 methyltransferase, partial [Bacteroidota bacterium]